MVARPRPSTFFLFTTLVRSSTVGGYVLHVEGSGAGTISDDHGLSPWSATPITPGTASSGVLDQIGDADYFNLTTTSAGRQYTTRHGTTDTIGYIYDSDLNVL